eukprot:1161010-Pelagomonas_calceolata.AAC.3
MGHAYIGIGSALIRAGGINHNRVNILPMSTPLTHVPRTSCLSFGIGYGTVSSSLCHDGRIPSQQNDDEFIPYLYKHKTVLAHNASKA